MNSDLIFLFDIGRFVDCNACVYWLSKGYHSVSSLAVIGGNEQWFVGGGGRGGLLWFGSNLLSQGVYPASRYKDREMTRLDSFFGLSVVKMIEHT
jgi:hypothetical protein